MDIPFKLKNIFHQNKRTTLEDVDTSTLSQEPIVARFKAHHDPLAQTYDPHLIKEFIDNIDQIYFSSTDDPAELELEKYGQVDNKSEIRNRLILLDKENRAVSKRVSELILEKQPSYQRELQRVIELQRTNLEALRQCSFIRDSLKLAEDGLIRSRLLVVTNNRRKRKLLEVMQVLKKITTLQQRVMKLRELIQSDDFYSAIELHRQCQDDLEDYQQYQCINKLRTKLKNIKVRIDDGLDGLLMKTCEQFDNPTYTSLQRAFSLQGNTQTTVNQLQMHYASAIRKRSLQIVLGYVKLCTNPDNLSGQKVTDISQLEYAELCKLLTGDALIPCITDLCKGLWVILRCYNQTILWHKREAIKDSQLKNQEQKNDERNSSKSHLSVNSGSPEKLNGSRSPSPNAKSPSPRHRRDDLSVTWHDYILGKLNHEKARLWSDLINKVRPVLEAVTLTSFSFEEIIRILALVRRFVQIGEEFCNSISTELQEVVRRQINSFFQAFHHKQLERLRMFLENEGWELCPVKSSFTILNLIEFRAFRSVLAESVMLSEDGPTSDRNPNLINNGRAEKISAVKVLKTEDSESICSDTQSSLGGQGCTFFEKFAHPETNPFDFPVDTSITEDILDDDPSCQAGDSDNDSDPESQSHHLNANHKTRHLRRRINGPVLANTTLEVFRLIGRYMQMLRLLKPIALEVSYGACQLFDYYFYTINEFFTNSNIDHVQKSFTPRVTTALKRIADRLILNQSDPSKQPSHVPVPELSPAIPLSSLDSLPCWIVAVESLTYLTNLMQNSLVPYLRDSLPEEKRGFISIFQEQTLPAARDLRQPAYQTFASRCLDYNRIPQMMASVNWAAREMSTRWSPYIDELSKMLEMFAFRLSEISQRVPIPSSTESLLWSLVLRSAAAALVEGYSQPTQCSPEGRSLMLLDLQQYILRAEPLTNLRPIPGKDLIEDFIKAFYVPVHELEQWTRDHRHKYTRKQLTNLVTCIVKDKKSRNRIINNLNTNSE